MNAITLIWRQVLKELKLFQMKKNKEDAAEKTEEEQLKTPESEGQTTGPINPRGTYIPAKTV